MSNEKLRPPTRTNSFADSDDLVQLVKTLVARVTVLERTVAALQGQLR